MPGVSDQDVRAGGRVLAVFENPLNARVLRAHADGPKRLAELQEKVGWAAPTTVRVALMNLCEIGAVQREAVDSSSHGVATALSPAGEEMLRVAETIEAWLAQCPSGPLAVDSKEAKVAIKALAGGWGSTLMRAVVSRPVTLTELSDLIPDVSYPALERRVAWMKTTGQIEAVESEGRGTPYVVTDWLRRSVAPICAAGRCERRHMEGEAARATSVEVEAAFLLVLPLVTLPPEANGSCFLAVQVEVDEPGRGPGPAGVRVEVAAGEIRSFLPRVEPNPSNWATGDSTAWLALVLEGQIDDLHIGGADPQLALDLVEGIHLALFDESRHITHKRTDL